MSFRCDPFGIFCFIVFYALIGYVNYVCLFFVLCIDRIGQQIEFYFLAAGLQLVMLMIVWSHIMCLFSNPGTVDSRLNEIEKLQRGDANVACAPIPCEIEYIFPPGGNNSKVYQKADGVSALSQSRKLVAQNYEWTFCKYCNIYRPPRAHHCQICRRCILRMDHHCPWINNCVGEYNQKYFLQFTSYTAIGSLYTLGCVFAAFYYAQVNTPIKVIHLALLILTSVIFGIFSLAVLCDQVQGVFNDQTSIERLTGFKGVKNGRLHMLHRTCGYISVPLWLFPIPIRSKRSIAKETHKEACRSGQYAL